MSEKDTLFLFQNSSVKLTWDETDQNRLHLTTKKFTEKDLESVDFSTLIASSESESEGEEGTQDSNYTEHFPVKCHPFFSLQSKGAYENSGQRDAWPPNPINNLILRVVSPK